MELEYYSSIFKEYIIIASPAEQKKKKKKEIWSICKRIHFGEIHFSEVSFITCKKSWKIGAWKITKFKKAFWLLYFCSSHIYILLPYCLAIDDVAVFFSRTWTRILPAIEKKDMPWWLSQHWWFSFLLRRWTSGASFKSWGICSCYNMMLNSSVNFTMSLLPTNLEDFFWNSICTRDLTM